MAYVSKEKKAKIKLALDEALKGTGVKATLAVRHHSAIVCTVRKGPVDFIGNYNQTQLENYGEHAGHFLGDRKYFEVNPYHYNKEFSGEALEIVSKIVKALNTDNYDNSDIQSDYFDVGHYVDLNIGTYEKPYELLAK